MVDFSAISGTITALKGVMDVAKAMKDLHASGAIDAQIGELNSKIIEAQVSAFAAHDERATLIERVGTLEAELARLKAWGAEKENYELKEIYRGAFAYALKPNTGRPEPAHWLCPTCYLNDQKSFLQDQGRDPAEDRTVRCGCPKCKTVLRVSYHVTPSKPWDGN